MTVKAPHEHLTDCSASSFSSRLRQPFLAALLLIENCQMVQEVLQATNLPPVTQVPVGAANGDSKWDMMGANPLCFMNTKVRAHWRLKEAENEMKVWKDLDILKPSGMHHRPKSSAPTKTGLYKKMAAARSHQTNFHILEIKAVQATQAAIPYLAIHPATVMKNTLVLEILWILSCLD